MSRFDIGRWVFWNLGYCWAISSSGLVGAVRTCCDPRDSRGRPPDGMQVCPALPRAARRKSSIRNVVAVLISWNKQGAPLRTKKQVCQWLNPGSRKFYVACYCTEKINSRFIKKIDACGNHTGGGNGATRSQKRDHW
jgi:hypothetical protein